MTYRIELENQGGKLVIEVHGVVDAAALLALRRAIAAAEGREVGVVLRFGSEVAVDCIEPLRRLEGAVVVAESPFLARWLANG